MKTILLFGYSAALLFSAISAPWHWSLRLGLSAAVLVALLHELSRRAPVGYQDKNGFHYSRAGGDRLRREPLLRTLLSQSRSPLKA